MENFMKDDIIVSKIRGANFFTEVSGKPPYRENGRPGHGLALYLGGERKIVFENGKKLTVKENTILYLPKGGHYVIKQIVTSSYYIINFNLPDGVVFEPFTLKLKNTDRFLESYKTAFKAFMRKNDGFRTKIMSELYNIIYNMKREYTLPYSGKSLKKIKPAIDYIHSNYAKGDISVSYLAELCSISQVYLRNIFFKNLGLTPVKYINNLKMTLAEDLLLSNLYSVREVCFMSGFQDESYFSREFKKKFGITPSEYAKTSRE